MAYVVGQAEVLVLPNARRFQEELGRQIAPTARRVGQDVGDELSRQSAQGLAKGLAEGGKTAGVQGDQAGGSFASGFQKRLKAALESLPDATVRLNVTDTAQLDRLRAELTALSTKRIGIDISAEEAEAKVRVLQAELTELGGRSSHVQLRVDTAAASAELAKFKTEMAAAGDQDGSIFAEGMRQAAVRRSPLIVAAISGGLIAGAPAVAAAGTLLFAGIAAASVASNKQVHQAAVDLGNDTMNVFRTAAAQTAPMFTAALQRMSLAVLALEPQLQGLFSGLGDPINLLTTGVINLVNNAMPGLKAIVQSSTPVFQGLASFLGSIGTGISDFLTIISQHGPAAGQVFSTLGTIVQNLLPALGEIVGAGVELASQVLPPLASALGVVNDVLQAIAPELPIILAAFLGFKAVSLLDGPLSNLATKLEGLGGLGSKAASAVSGIASALPVLGVAVAIGGAIFETAKKQVDDWATALNEGGAAAERARVEMQKQDDTVTVLNTGFQGVLAHLLGYGAGLDIVAGQSGRATAAAQDQIAAMTPLEKAQLGVTAAQNDYLYAVDKWGAKSGQAIAASYTYRDAQDALAKQQEILKAAQDGVSLTTEQNITRLQEIATTASTATSTINLFKGALDALTGVQVSQLQAEAAVTQAVQAAEAAVKNKTGALVDDTGAINTSTEAGAAAAQGLANLASTDNTLIATMEQHGATAADVTKKDGELRDSFIKTAENMGFSAGQAENLANQIYGIPEQRRVEIEADTGAAQRTIDAFVKGINGQGLIGIIRTVGGLAEGGTVPGSSPHDRADNVPIMATAGEFMQPVKAVKMYGPGFMEAVRTGTFPVEAARGYADGGYIGYPSYADFVGFTDMTDAAKGKLAAAKAKAAASFSGDAAAGVGLAGSINRALGITIANSMGYGGQFAAIDYIFSHESGWRNTAQNPTSTAYGIPQFLNATWAAYGGKTSDPATQIRDGIMYMRDRYGSPNAAANFWKSHHWYHDGGVVQGPAGANVPAILQAGETVRTREQEAALHGGAVTLQLDGPATQALMRGEAVTVVTGALGTATGRTQYSAARR